MALSAPQICRLLYLASNVFQCMSTYKLEFFLIKLKWKFVTYHLQKLVSFRFHIFLDNLWRRRLYFREKSKMLFQSWRPKNIMKSNEKLLKYGVLTDTGEDSKLVHRRKRPKVDTLFSALFSDASERRVWLSIESKILASTFGRFRLYRLNNSAESKFALKFK